MGINVLAIGSNPIDSLASASLVIVLGIGGGGNILIAIFCVCHTIHLRGDSVVVNDSGHGQHVVVGIHVDEIVYVVAGVVSSDEAVLASVAFDVGHWLHIVGILKDGIEELAGAVIHIV